MKNIFKWVYFAGLLIAIVASLVSITNPFDAPWLMWVLLILGILVGIFFFDSDDIVNFGIRYLALAGASAALAYFDLGTVGTYLASFFGAVLLFLTPIVLTVLVVWFIKKYFLK